MKSQSRNDAKTKKTVTQKAKAGTKKSPTDKKGPLYNEPIRQIPSSSMG